MKLFKVTAVILLALLCAFFLTAQEKADKKKDKGDMVRIENLGTLEALKDLDIQIEGLEALKNIKIDLKGLDSLRCLENLDIRLEGLEALDALGDIEFDIKGLEALERLGDIKFDFNFSHLEGLADRISESVMKSLDGLFESIDFMDWDFDWED